MIKYLKNLERRLLLPLPGKEAQFQMAPSYRLEMQESGSKQMAGVTILLYSKNDRLFFPLIERPIYDGAHSGQISFPGGKMDKEDRNLTCTALRECEEEIGIDSSTIIVLGCLSSLFIPVSKFEVYPIIGLCKEKPIFKPQVSEVVSILEIPLDLILSEEIKEVKSVLYNGAEEKVPYYNIFNKMVWGATAMILSEFIQVWKESTDIYSEARFL